MPFLHSITAPFRALRNIGRSHDTDAASTTDAPAAQPTIPGSSDEFVRTPARAATPARSEALLPVGSTDANGNKVLIDWKADRSTWNIDWFPMRAEGSAQGDPNRNLWARGGALDKYDQVFGTRARLYELQNSSLPIDSRDKDASWKGHCNNASQISFMLDEPRRENTEFGGVNFTKNDVKGLLVSVSDNLMDSKDWVGKRSGGGLFANKGDPKPLVLLDALQDWTSEGRPFVMDTSPGGEVWNYPYDRVKVTEGWNGNTRLLNFDITSTGFPDEAQHYEGFVKEHRFLGTHQGWYGQANNAPNPDFLWRPHMTEGPWTGASDLNPQVRAEDVYKIYQASMQD